MAEAAFFSYSREDSEFALRLAEDLKAAGALVWIDQLDIAPGEEWDNAIEDAVTRCPRMLLILSVASVKSKKVRNEIAFALDEEKTIIPVLFQDCPVPLQLRRVQHIDFRTDYARGLKSLLKALGVEPQMAAAAATAPAVEAHPAAPDSGVRRLVAEQVELERQRRLAAERARQEEERKQATAEQARLEEERKQSAEKVREEEEQKQAAEKALLEEAERERQSAAEKARREKAEHERQAALAAAEKARREQVERERQAAEQARLEEDRKQAAEQVRMEVLTASHAEPARTAPEAATQRTAGETAAIRATPVAPPIPRPAEERSSGEGREFALPRSALRRMFLLYRPVKPKAWKFHLLFYGFAFVVFPFLMLLSFGAYVGDRTWLGFAIWGPLGLLIGWALRRAARNGAAGTRRKLMRSQTDRTIAGVCAGFADRFGLPVTVVRVVWVIVSVFTGAGVLAYLIAWILMPTGPEPVRQQPLVDPSPRLRWLRRNWKWVLSAGLALLLLTILMGLGLFLYLRGAKHLRSVTFTSPQSGWAVGRKGTILHTADGGRSWLKQGSGIDGWLESVTFATPQSGWAVGTKGAILHTEDGGRSWQQQSSGTSEELNSVFFATPQSGWAVGSEGAILHSEDGGRSWQQQSGGTDAWLSSVFFATPQLGWAVGDKGTILHTDDGGRSWQQQSGGTDAWLSSVFLVTPQSGWAVGGKGGSEPTGVILHTEDGGHSWQRQSNDISDEILVIYGLYWVSAVTPQSAWAVGENGTILHTEDGGRRWEDQNSDTGAGLRAVAFATPQSGWAVGAMGTILHTENGGRSWQPQSSGIGVWFMRRLKPSPFSTAR